MSTSMNIRMFDQAASHRLIHKIFNGETDSTELTRLDLEVEMADPNFSDRQGWSSFHRVAYTGDVATGRLLREHGADMNTKTDCGRTPLMLAASVGRFDFVDFLLAQGADKELQDSGNGFTAFHYAAQYSVYTPDVTGTYGCPVRTIEQLVRHGANIDSRAPGNKTPLFVTLEDGSSCSESVVEALLSHGANFQARDSYYRTPLAVCAEFGLLEAGLKLLKRGADPNVRDGPGGTPMEIARRREHHRLVEEMERFGNSSDFALASQEQQREYDGGTGTLIDIAALADPGQNGAGTPTSNATQAPVARAPRAATATVAVALPIAGNANRATNSTSTRATNTVMGDAQAGPVVVDLTGDATNSAATLANNSSSIRGRIESLQTLIGITTEGCCRARIVRLEQEIFGANHVGNIPQRLERLEEEIGI